ncbi:MAG: hypothetical protein IKW83_00325 [Muribaculaceae bacterium]|nr:hypothetical protein [Muribaculaceae bacterium]
MGNDIKKAILAKVNHDMRERDKSVQAIWYAMEGKLLTEQDRLYHMGIKVEVEELLKDVSGLINETLSSLQQSFKV